MIQWKSIGAFREKNVALACEPCLDFELDPVSLRTSLVLLIFNIQSQEEVKVDEFFTVLATGSPLGISVSGKNAETAFTRLITVLSDCNSNAHIMTALIEEDSIEEILEGFLFGIWPAEERFSEWESYSILAIGEFEIAKIQAATERIISPQ